MSFRASKTSLTPLPTPARSTCNFPTDRTNADLLQCFFVRPHVVSYVAFGLSSSLLLVPKEDCAS